MTTQAKSLHLPPQLLDSPLNLNFSGGEQKKTELLQLVNLKPRFAILDEPDTGLDIDSQPPLAAAINSALAQNTGILLITHTSRLLSLIKPTAIHIIRSGRIVKTGSSKLVQQIERSGYATINR